MAMDKEDKTIVKVIVWCLGVILAGTLAGMAGCPVYRVWEQGLSGEAKLREAEYSRQIAVEEAQAKKAAAVELAEAEKIRAGGVAEANKIIGESLAGNEAYLRYLWIQGLHDGSSEIIYIPTEANLPILEAMRKAPKPTLVSEPAEE